MLHESPQHTNTENHPLCLLSPQDQTTWISLIKKYWSKRLTEDELKTLNDLNPDFVPELPMPVYTGETIRATMQGEFPTIDDILNSVLTQEQRDQKDQIIGRISEMLSDDQKRRIENGEDIEAIIGELSPLQQSEIKELGYSPMNDDQHQDFIFLMNGIFEDVALDERMAILQHLKNNEGTITANDIMSMAREAQKKGLKGGYFVWLLEHYNEKDLNDFASLIEYAFGTSLTGLTLDHLNADYMAQHQAEASMLTTIAFANAAGAVVNRWMFGRALAPDEMYDPNRRLDSIERDGTTGKPGGIQPLEKPPEAAGWPDGGQPAGTNESSKYFDDAQLKTEPNKAYFWSGLGETGAETAANIAGKNGGVTLETTIEGQGIKMPKFDFNNPTAIEAWRSASEAYARQVSGEVKAIVSSNLRPTSIWNAVELPALKANPNVT